MIVSCPQCSARYRVRDDKIQGAGARIRCPECAHQFVVYRQSAKMVVGGNEPQPLGLPVTFARGGKIQRTSLPMPEDDEDDAPTTLMPHGSALAEQFRQSIAEERARILEENEEEAAQAAPPPPAPKPPARDPLRAAQQTKPKKAPVPWLRYAGVLVGFVVLCVAAYAIFYAVGLRN